ncbi:MAG: LiaF-related protein [Ignavibacteriae bacterium]|nr:LiaF-related protein [Ignavibacteriota bacterium]
MKRYLTYTGLFLLLATSVVFAAILLETTRKDIPLTSEKELRANIEAAFGTIIVKKGDRDKVVAAEFRQHEDAPMPRVDYKLRGDRGELHIETDNSDSRWWGGKRDKDDRKREWMLKFTDAVPIDFKIEFGAGEGEIDLTGLQVLNLSISSGASSADLVCDEPNPVIAEHIDIESGVSEFDAYNLANLNFEKMNFSGGVGSYKLDFGGKLQRDAKVKVEVGLGAVTIYLPRETAARVEYEDHWFAGFDIDDGFKRVKKGVYETDNYERAKTRLTFELEAGLGSVKVRQR